MSCLDNFTFSSVTYLLTLLLFNVFEKASELRVGIRSQGCRLIKLSDSAVGKDHDSVAAHDGVESMGDGDHGAPMELPGDQALDLQLSHYIDIGCGLVKDDNTRAAHNGSADADQLLLSG